MCGCFSGAQCGPDVLGLRDQDSGRYCKLRHPRGLGMLSKDADGRVEGFMVIAIKYGGVEQLRKVFHDGAFVIVLE